mgnify:CR=1 FL=1
MALSEFRSKGQFFARLSTVFLQYRLQFVLHVKRRRGVRSRNLFTLSVSSVVLSEAKNLQALFYKEPLR